jgi:molybdopterin molybdotransferase
MLSVSEAREIVVRHAARLPAQRVCWLLSHGLVLAGDVVSDTDEPRFAKALVDGYAVRSQDFQDDSARELSVVAEVDAGQVSSRGLAPGTCALVMTGAPLPDGADAVVLLEQSERAAVHAVRLRRSGPAGYERNGNRPRHEGRRGRHSCRHADQLGAYRRDGDPGRSDGVIYTLAASSDRADW